MKEITDSEYHLIRDYIKKNFGINLGSEKRALIYTRLRTTLQDNGFDDFSQYFAYLQKDASGEVVSQFIDKITTNHTFFMREIDHFDYLREKVLPYIESKHCKERDVRLWCAGCSTGEEPYALEMILQDYFGRKEESWNTQILATDISTGVLKKAAAGMYPNESLKALPSKWRSEYFKKVDDSFSVVEDKVKKQIVYRKFNLMEDKFPFKKNMQIIFCRNVMIYFDNQTRDKLVEKFYDLTESGGYLFIGHSESLNHTCAEYKYLMPAVYRKE
ncbi:MAG: protein-glutamate O-methyltransferase CheR [Clostridiales bacterium]|nr:protein-glutamate O-methyltransferase CheR [Clostridiales bacterium]